MALYFFRLRDDGVILPDDGEGEELSDLEAARLYAITSARQILSEAVLRGKAASLHQQIEVLDDTGRMVLTVPVGHATDTDTQS